MFDFSLTEEQQQLIDTARKFTAEHIIPVAGELDEQEKFPTEIFEQAWELGLMNCEIPEAYGGLGLGTVDGCLISEELAYGCAAIATSVMCNHLGALPLMVGGSEEQKQHWLGKLGDEFQFVSYCCSEPDAGSDVAGMKSRLTPRPGGGFILNGQKRWITNGGHASFYTGFATVDPALKHKGITAFVVPRVDPRGMSISPRSRRPRTRRAKSRSPKTPRSGPPTTKASSGSPKRSPRPRCPSTTPTWSSG